MSPPLKLRLSDRNKANKHSQIQLIDSQVQETSSANAPDAETSGIKETHERRAKSFSD